MKGYVYAIGTQWSEPVKIGVAGSVADRLSTLQAGNPRQLHVLWKSDQFQNPVAAERHLHDCFTDFRLRGEWFILPEGTSLSEALLNFEDGPRTSALPKDITEESTAANVAATTLIDRWSRRKGISSAAAIEEISEKYGLPSGFLWAMRYRPGRDIGMSRYAKLVVAVWNECGHEFRGEWPLADELIEAARLMGSAPIDGDAPIDARVFRRLRSQADIGHLDKIEELIAALQAERLDAPEASARPEPEED